MSLEAAQFIMRDGQHLALQRWLARTRWQNRLLSDFALYLTEGTGWLVFLPLPCGGYHGLALHLRPLGGRSSDPEPRATAVLRSQGFRVDRCHCWESAREAVERYLGRFGTIQERGNP